MRSTSSGMLTDFLKEAGIIGSGARTVGAGLSHVGGAVWNAAGKVAPNPAARAGLLGVTALGVATQAPAFAGRLSNDAAFVRGEVPSASRGF